MRGYRPIGVRVCEGEEDLPLGFSGWCLLRLLNGWLSAIGYGRDIRDSVVVQGGGKYTSRVE